jgi:hypothetical protein
MKRHERPVSRWIGCALIIAIGLNLLVVWATWRMILDDGLRDAAASGNRDAVADYLRRGADPGTSDSELGSAAQLAEQNGHPEVAKLIREWKAK